MIRVSINTNSVCITVVDLVQIIKILTFLFQGLALEILCIDVYHVMSVFKEGNHQNRVQTRLFSNSFITLLSRKGS